MVVVQLGVILGRCGFRSCLIRRCSLAEEQLGAVSMVYLAWLVASWVEAWMEVVEEVLSLTAVLMTLLGTFAEILRSSERKARAARPNLADLDRHRRRFACAHMLRARPLHSALVQAMISLHPH